MTEVAKLKRSHNKKVATAHGRVKNTFGLPAGISCPGETPVCRGVCYAKRQERIPTAKALRDLLHHNWELLQTSVPEMVRLLGDMVADFLAECTRYGVPPKFRIHWDGDFFSYEYAASWACVIRQFPDVQFWVYTRSLDFVDALAGISNLALYLSGDASNFEEVLRVHRRFPTTRIAYLGKTMMDGKAAMASAGLRPGAACPENTRQIPLIKDKIGACIACGLCITGKADVRFSVVKP